MGEAKRKKAIAQALGIPYAQHCREEKRRLFDNMVESMVELIKLKVRQRPSLGRCPNDEILRRAVIEDLNHKGIQAPQSPK